MCSGYEPIPTVLQTSSFTAGLSPSSGILFVSLFLLAVPCGMWGSLFPNQGSSLHFLQQKLGPPGKPIFQFFILFFIYLFWAVSSLSCSMQELSLWHSGFSVTEAQKPHGMWNLNSLTRYPTHISHIARDSIRVA